MSAEDEKEEMQKDRDRERHGAKEKHLQSCP
jgi:hypothetical protein